MKKVLLSTFLLTFMASSAPAGDLIRKACVRSGRPAASQELCVCIQQVADTVLTKRRDQRLAASFFRNPHKAQVIRQSDNPRNEVFWLRYKEWGNAAEKSCGKNS